MGDDAARRGTTASQPTRAGLPPEAPAPDAVEAVRTAASQLLDATFASLSEGHVLPRPRFAPWIRMAHDYYGDMLRGGVDFDRALKAAWPRRFDVSGSGSPGTLVTPHPLDKCLPLRGASTGTCQKIRRHLGKGGIADTVPFPRTFKCDRAEWLHE